MKRSKDARKRPNIGPVTGKMLKDWTATKAALDLNDAEVQMLRELSVRPKQVCEFIEKAKRRGWRGSGHAYIRHRYRRVFGIVLREPELACGGD